MIATITYSIVSLGKYFLNNGSLFKITFHYFGIVPIPHKL